MRTPHQIKRDIEIRKAELAKLENELKAVNETPHEKWMGILRKYRNPLDPFKPIVLSGEDYLQLVRSYNDMWRRAIRAEMKLYGPATVRHSKANEMAIIDDAEAGNH